MVFGYPKNPHSSCMQMIEAPIFKGKACQTAFAAKEQNPQNKRGTEWKGAKPKRAKDTPAVEVAKVLSE